MCLDTLLKLNDYVIDLSPPKRFVNVMTKLMSGSNMSVPWTNVMPSHEYKAFVKKVENEAIVALAGLSKDYYEGCWVTENAVFGALKPAKVDAQAWQALMDAKVGNMPVVETFRPDHKGFADPVRYDRFNTRTGRLTVASGPNILTLKREYRSIIKSSFPDGCIVYLDFAALEARVLLYESGGRCDEPDLYEAIVRDVFKGKVSRKIVKGAVISELYGSSKHSLGQVLGMSGKELDNVINKVRVFFKTKDLKKRVKQEFVEKGYITNRYGRRVAIDEPLDRIFINSYAQSTGCDVVLLGFAQILSELSQVQGIRPLYLLHDALLIDCAREAIPIVKSKQWVKVKGYVQKFVLKAETLECTQ